MKTHYAIQPPDVSSLCRAITEHAPLPMATVEGASHIVRYVNPAFCRLMDKPAEQLVGKPFAEILPEKDVSVTLLDRVFRTGKPESHTEQQHSKPHSVFWTYTMWPVLADELPVGIMIQVTETAQFHEKTLAMNEALMLGSLRQHELTEAANASNVQLQTEITERVRLEREHAIAGERIGVLLQELTHRIKNSLQIIVSMVSLEARNQKSGEGKAALERVSHRIAALGRLYSMLGETNSGEAVDAASYLEALCRDLIESVQKENGISIALKTDIASESLAGRSRDSARAHCQRAGNECRQICFPRRAKRHNRCDAKTLCGGASPDGRRRRAMGRSSTRGFRVWRPVGRFLCATARRPGRTGEQQQGNHRVSDIAFA